MMKSAENDRCHKVVSSFHFRANPDDLAVSAMPVQYTICPRQGTICYNLKFVTDL